MNERDIFLEAIEITDPAERASWLVQACDGNADLQARVEELLQAHEDASRFLETPAVATDSAANQTILTDTSDSDDDPTAEWASAEAEFRRYLQPSTRPDWLGRLGHYEIEEILGRGAFGIVAKAFDEKLHRVVAIKLMSPELASTSPPRKRFLREARTAAAVTHENIVAIHAVEEEPIPYLVMEYIAGQTLQQRMDQHGPLEVADLLCIGQQVAAGLAAAHAVNLIHRDIKPSNILLSDGPSERAKISDFGLARAVDDASLTSSGQITGTPLYMAPEQARGETLDHRADLFSLGSVLYQMAGGRPPFRAANTIAVLKRVCEDTPRPLADVLPGTPAWLETIIFKLLEKERGDRFQTAQEVADLLARCQQELEHNGQVTCVAERSGNARTRVSLSADAHRNGPSKKPFGWLFAGVMAVAIIIGLLTIIGNRDTSAPDVTNSSAVAAVASATGTPADPAESTGWHGWPADAPPPAIAPFDAAQAKVHQEAWAKYLGVPVEYENSIGMKFRLIPPGEFMMGSTPEEIEAALKVDPGEARKKQVQSEGPQHRVILTQPVYFGVTEVTQAQYEHVMETNPSHFSTTGSGKEAVANLETGNHPVENVSWRAATKFCAKLSEKEKLKQFYIPSGETVAAPLKASSYRLPTEAEWEFACRAGTTTPWWIGDSDVKLIQAGWFGRSSGRRTHAVGELLPNPFGLFDVHGNVWEYVQDSWDPGFYGKFAENPAIDPFSSFFADAPQVARGGGWGFNSTSLSRSSYRMVVDQVNVLQTQGLRVVLTMDVVRQQFAAEASGSPQPKPAGWHGWPADVPPPAIAPFDTAQAKVHQELWAKYLGVPVEYENSIGMKFRLIPPGEFLMGSTPEEIEAALDIAGENPGWRERIQTAAPQHRVVLTQPLYFGVTEVTQTQYEQVMGANPSHFSATGAGKDALANLETGSHPVESVSWNDAAEFCAKLSQQEQLKPFYFRSGERVTPLDGTGYRLPTEAEWESACRAGTTTRFWSGDDYQVLIQAGWFGRHPGDRTHAVGELKANPFGLFDIHGHVVEWVQDSWDAAFYEQFREKAAVDPSSPFIADSERVLRGGRWGRNPSNCRSATRDSAQSTNRDSGIGFRVVLVAASVRVDRP